VSAFDTFSTRTRNVTAIGSFARSPAAVTVLAITNAAATIVRDICALLIEFEATEII
jgi:hypothetical protein